MFHIQQSFRWLELTGTSCIACLSLSTRLHDCNNYYRGSVPTDGGHPCQTVCEDTTRICFTSMDTRQVTRNRFHRGLGASLSVACPRPVRRCHANPTKYISNNAIFGQHQRSGNNLPFQLRDHNTTASPMSDFSLHVFFLLRTRPTDENAYIHTPAGSHDNKFGRRTNTWHRRVTIGGVTVSGSIRNSPFSPRESNSF